MATSAEVLDNRNNIKGQYPGGYYQGIAGKLRGRPCVQTIGQCCCWMFASDLQATHND
jgi:hypothetical protein